MSRFTSKSIRALFEANKKQAQRKLRSLKVCCTDEPDFAGLNGWVFEQTIQYCIRQELLSQGVRPRIEEQFNLGGRARADLKIGGNIAIEIKVAGLFSEDDILKYKKYRQMAEQQGFRYLFLSWEESHLPFRKGIARVLDAANVFYLDRSQDWKRFINGLVEFLKKTA